MDTIFEIGSWVSTEDGLGQILYNRQLYIENFSFAAKEGKKGKLERVMYICKILCDFNGKLKPRNSIRNYTSVSPVNSNEARLIEKIKETDEAGYNKYILYEDKDYLTRQTFLTYKIDEHQVDEVISKINEINKALKPSFIFKEFVAKFKMMDMPFSIQDYYRKGISYDRSEVISLRFDSVLYKVKGKNSVFHNVVAIKI